VGVFVCNCGINIGGVADVPAVREYAATLPHVVHVEDNLFTCSQDTQDKMKEVIKEKGINRVVVASCSPRTHEPLFQETIRDAGLNKYLFEMANIRDQNTWVHMNNPERATAKAKDLVRMAVAKSAFIEPLHQVRLEVTQKVLVVGGGVAGMEAALGLAGQGIPVFLVERDDQLGGVAHKLRSTWQGEPVRPYLEDLIARVCSHEKIRVFMKTEAVETTGIMGNFTTTLMTSGESLTETVVEHGATILATGGKEYIPSEYRYGQHPNVLTHFELDAAMDADDPGCPRLARRCSFSVWGHGRRNGLTVAAYAVPTPSRALWDSRNATRRWMFMSCTVISAHTGSARRSTRKPGRRASSSCAITCKTTCPKWVNRLTACSA
jgi:heterodisulfide reductase subunit A-like polyferredoxin